MKEKNENDGIGSEEENNEQFSEEQNFPLEPILSMDISTEVRDWLLSHIAKILAGRCKPNSPIWKGIFTNIKGKFWFQMAQHSYLLQLDSDTLNKICRNLLTTKDRNSMSYWQKTLCWYVENRIKPKWSIEKIIEELEEGKEIIDSIKEKRKIEKLILLIKEWAYRVKKKSLPKRGLNTSLIIF